MSHFRHASVNTAFEPRPQSRDGNLSTFSRARTPAGHNRVPSLGSAEKSDEISQPLLYEVRDIPLPPLKRRSNVVLTSAWILSVFLTSLCTFLLTQWHLSAKSVGTFETGYMTELRDARSSVHVQKQQFFGSLDFKERTGFVPIGSPSLKFVGTGPEVDAAWDALTKDRYFLLSDEEAREAYGDQPDQYWNTHHGGYVAGLDVLHTLHCLNHLRMGLYPEYYPQDPRHSQMHKAHCVDHLRQLAMCNADLTPVPTQFFVGLGRNYINSSQLHTCRDFSRVREWATERFNGSTAVKARNRDGSLRPNFYAPWGP